MFAVYRELEGSMQLAAHVRADRPNLPIVLMSGYSDELAGLGEDAPLTRLLRKPFTHQELLTAVDALLTDESLDPVPRPAPPVRGRESRAT